MKRRTSLSPSSMVVNKEDNKNRRDAMTKLTAIPGFLAKTYSIFSNSEYEDICGWNSEGNAIVIKDFDRFLNEILPRHFKHNNYSSFVRQLNMYDFHKTIADSTSKEFRHAYFKRDRQDLLPLIKRKTSQAEKYHTHRAASDDLLSELRALRKKSDNMERRILEMERDNISVRRENDNLWHQLLSSKENQQRMQRKMQRILFVLYQIYLQGSNKDKQKSIADASRALLADDDSGLGPDDFRSAIQFLDMDEPAYALKNIPSSPIKRKHPRLSLDSGKTVQPETTALSLPLRQFGSPLPPAINIPDQPSYVEALPTPPVENTSFQFEELEDKEADSPKNTTGSRTSMSLSNDTSSDKKIIKNDAEILSADKGIRALPSSIEEKSNESSLSLDEEEELMMKKLGDFETELFKEFDPDEFDSLLKQYEALESKSSSKVSK